MPKNNETARKKKPGKKSPYVRGLLAVLRWVVFPVLCLAALYVGLRIGFVRFGGGDPDDVLRIETWKHMLDLVFKDT